MDTKTDFFKVLTSISVLKKHTKKQPCSSLFQVERSDRESVTQEDREYAVQWLFKTDSGELIKQSGLVMKRTGKDRWTGSHVEGQRGYKYFPKLLRFLRTKLHQSNQ